MLPVSGAEQFVASPSSGDVPMTSHNGAYSTFVRPGPCSASGRKRFQRSRLRASTFSSSITGGGKCGSPDSGALVAVDRLRGPDDVVVELDELGLQLVGSGAQGEVHVNLLVPRTRAGETLLFGP